MKYLLKFTPFYGLQFDTLREATKALEAIHNASIVSHNELKVDGNRKTLVWPDHGEVQLIRLEEDQVRIEAPIIGDDFVTEVGTNYALEMKRKPRRRGLLLGNGS